MPNGLVTLYTPWGEFPPLHGRATPGDVKSVEPIEPGAATQTEAASAEWFVGRDKELRQLEACLASTDGRLLLITGPAGVGKTRLAQEFATRATAQGRRVLRGSCWDVDGAPAFWPFIVVLRNHLAGAEASANDVGASADLDELLTQCLRPGSRRPTSAVAPPTTDPQHARFQLFDRYASVLRDLTTKQPSVMILDDIQWADTGSLLLLQFLAAGLDEIPLLCVVTSRDPLPALVSATCRHPWTQLISLSGLDASEAATLLRGRGVATSEPRVIDKLTVLTDGNPFFLKELTQWLADTPTELSSDWPHSLPPSLRGLTLHHFEGLSADCRAVLQLASVIGRDFDPDLVAEACGQPAARVLGTLQEAFAKGVITPIGPTKYRFAHALVREAVYDDLPVAQRARWHEQIALILETRGGSGPNPLAAIAHHFFLALPLVTRNKARSACIAAAQEAHRIYAYEAAVAYLGRAIQLCGPTTEASDRCELLLLLGAAQGGAGDWMGSRRSFRDASALARHLDDPSYFSRAAIGFKGVMLATIPVDADAVLLLEEACERAKHHGPLLVELLAALTGSLHFSESPSIAERHARKAFRLAKGLRDERLDAIATQARALSLWRPEHVAEVVKLSAKLTRLAVRLQDPFLEFQAAIFRHSGLLVLGRIDDSDYELDRATHLANSTRHPRLQWQVAVIRRARAVVRGDVAEADRLTADTQHLGARVHDTTPAHYEMIYRFQRALLNNDLAQWPEIANVVLQRFPTVPGYRAAIALMYARLGRAREARQHLQYFVGAEFSNIPSNSTSLWILSMLGEASSLYGDAGWTRSVYDRLEQYSKLIISVAWGVLIDGSVAHYLGVMAAALNRIEQAIGHFEQALKDNVLLNATVLLARTQLVYAELLCLHSDDRSRALELTTLAHATFDSCGFMYYAKRASDLSALLGSSSGGQAGGHARQSTRQTELGDASENILRRDGDYWLLSYHGRRTYIRHCIGLEYIREVLSAAGASLHVLDLHRVTTPSALPDSPGQEISDAVARRQYQSQMADIQEELSIAEANNDIGARERLNAEREALSHHLFATYGLAGRSRSFSSAAERARINVRNRVTAALTIIRRHNELAYQHLSRSIRTGRLCSYQPEQPTTWALY